MTLMFSVHGSRQNKALEALVYECETWLVILRKEQRLKTALE